MCLNITIIVVTSTRSVISKLATVRYFPRRAHFVKGGVKDFYMDSSHSQCVRNNVEAVKRHLACGRPLPFMRSDDEGDVAHFNVGVFSDCLSFLLRSQFIDIGLDDTLFEVR